MGSEQGRKDYGGLGTERIGGGQDGDDDLDVPPPVPPKDLPPLPPEAAKLTALPPALPASILPAPTEPPKGPLPPTPSRPSTATSRPGTAAASRPSTAASPKPPLPTLAPSFRSPQPLNMNPPTRPATATTTRTGAANTPTRPNTATTQTSGMIPIRLAGSTKRLSWTSLQSRRPIKYAQGKFGRVELVPQPSDDPDDPLVSWVLIKKSFLKLTRHRTGRHGAKNFTSGLSF